MLSNEIQSTATSLRCVSVDLYPSPSADLIQIYNCVFAEFRKKGSAKRRMWTKEERDAAQQHMQQYITLMRVPRKYECDIALKDPRLGQRDWKAIKFFVKNIITSMQKH